MTTRPIFRSVQALLLVPCLLLAASLAEAADLGWRGKGFDIMASDKPLGDFFRELAATQGTRAVVDPKVEGTISGKFSGSARSVLDSVTATHGLTWYYDGSFLYIDPVGDSRSEVIQLSPGSAGRIGRALARMKISDPRFPLEFSERDGTAFVSGPRRYVENVRQALRVIDDRVAQTDRSEIRLFPLKYAWASDFRVTRQGMETVVPGVAATLRELFSREAPSSAQATPMVPLRVGPTRRLRLSSGDEVNVPKIDLQAAEPQLGSASGAELPRFHADGRVNAVLVRDLPERMAQYARVIEALDVRPRLVEIEVTIMDVATDTLDSLGVDWRLHGRHADLQIGRGDAPPLTWDQSTSEAGQTAATTPVGATFTASIGHDLRNYLLTRIRALASTGQANLAAKPKLLTLDNTQATLDSMSEFHVRVGGFQDAGLFSITAGTAVRVTPLIVDSDDAAAIKLSIDIDDGSLAVEAVDNIPIVRRRSVTTQALIAEGKSLLIAGFSSEEKVSLTVGVPGLSSVPVLGALFRFQEAKHVNMERLYLLTPRLVVPEAEL